MVFSSLTFIFFFLPFALLVYYISPKKMKNIVLLVVSLLFYAWGEPIYIFLMLFSATIDYFHGLLIFKYRISQKIKAKMALISSLIVNISILTFFKYADFLVDNLNNVLSMNIAPLDLPLPIGISFYTFQTMSYSIDVYRGHVKPQKNPITLALYVTLFPQLIAGPIVRYERIEKELQNRTWNAQQFSDGVRIFIIGLGKKVLIANTIGQLWFNIENQSINELTIFTAWLGIMAFAFQIFFDFSGYSDMAIGLGKMFGFNFPKNFNYPYISKSVTEFWRRWHISLGSWFRDYVYFPLGGSRKGKLITYRNLFIVWGITGLWHGASWNFILWGLYFGVIIAIEKAGLLKVLNKIHPFFQHFYLLFIVLISWVLFVFEDFSKGIQYAKVMFGISTNAFYDTQFFYYLYTNIILFLIAAIASTPVIKYVNLKVLTKLSDHIRIPIQKFVPLFFYIFILFLSTAYLVDDSFNPFLYFRF
ncbi:MBOAT family O-acyltransferase [Sporosarcina siberiensis]|uniref:MBOAT family O-acyltransferase n=1 Tax=Sporosarcina siberiensis TaxID=1365606 RepID=A0ABW4SH34_9BACL